MSSTNGLHIGLRYNPKQQHGFNWIIWEYDSSEMTMSRNGKLVPGVLNWLIISIPDGDWIHVGHQISFKRKSHAILFKLAWEGMSEGLILF